MTCQSHAYTCTHDQCAGSASDSSSCGASLAVALFERRCPAVKAGGFPRPCACTSDISPKQEIPNRVTTGSRSHAPSVRPPVMAPFARRPALALCALLALAAAAMDSTRTRSGLRVMERGGGPRAGRLPRRPQAPAISPRSTNRRPGASRTVWSRAQPTTSPAHPATATAAARRRGRARARAMPTISGRAWRRSTRICTGAARRAGRACSAAHRHAASWALGTRAHAVAARARTHCACTHSALRPSALRAACSPPRECKLVTRACVAASSRSPSSRRRKRP
jgi:hypothetical protein